VCCQGGYKSVGCRSEDGLDCVADYFVEHAAMRRDNLSEQRNVTSNCSGHCGVVPLPQADRAYDIGEEERDSTAR
jgi:hypothetical protein